MNKELALQLKIISTPLLIDNYISGKKYRQEDYLLDFLNSSKWFRNKSPAGYIRPESESNGEPDAYSEPYSIDFKRIVSQTKSRAKHELSMSISQIMPGVISYGVPKKENCEMQTTVLHVALRDMSLTELLKLCDQEVKSFSVEDDIKRMLKTLEKKKHLLLFFPFELSYRNINTGDTVEIAEEEIVDAIEDMRKQINNDFRNSFKYREHKVADFETYFSHIFQGKFVIYLIEQGEMRYIESISVSCSKLYMELSDIAEYW